MSAPVVGFEADWLVARRPYDDAALDSATVREIQAWAHGLPMSRRLVVVDLGCGTGVALQRATGWLAPRPFAAYGVDADATLLSVSQDALATRLVGDLLSPLDRLGGPRDGTVDLVLGHAVADLLPLDRLARRVAALLRPGGLAHLALTYDGLTAFQPSSPIHRVEADLDDRVIDAFHRRMDRRALVESAYGGSTAGRRMASALAAAGLTVTHDAPSVWHVAASDGPTGRAVLDRLIRYVVNAASEAGTVRERHVQIWERAQRGALADGTLRVRVGHRDVLAWKPSS